MHIAEFSVRNPVLANLLMAASIGIGLFLAWRMPLEMFPSIRIEMVSISAVFPGASAEDVEQLVSIPIEDAIRDLKGVRLVRSVSQEGRCIVIAELEPGEDVRKVAQDIRSEIAKIQNQLPADVDPPTVEEVEAEFPLVNVSIAGDVPRPVLRQYALRLRDELKQVAGAGRIFTIGVGDPAFWVQLDMAKVRQYHLSLDAIMQAIRARNIDLPAGSYEQGRAEFLVRTQGRIRRVEDLLVLPLQRDPRGHQVLLRDVAHVELGEEELTTLARVNGKPAVTFWVNKQKNADTVETARRIRAKVAEFQRRLPEELEVIISSDVSYWVGQRFRTMVRTGLIGLTVVLLLLALFLDIRAAAMAALGLPVSILGAIILMNLSGVTLNIISMFGLIVVIGIIVDDAIIVAENIQRYVQMGLPPKEAAIRGTREVTRPVVATILTNIAAFLPLLMATGMIGKFLATIPQVAIYAFAISLMEALLILPSHCADFLRPVERGKPARSWIFRVRVYYLRALFFVIRHRYLIVGAFVFILLLTLGVLARMPFVLFYQRDIPQFMIRVENPTWSDIMTTQAVVQKLERLVREHVPPHMLKSVVALVGIDLVRGDMGIELGDHLATIVVDYEVFEKRKENGLRVMNEVRRKAQDLVFPGRVEFIPVGGPPRGKPVDVRIQGKDFKTLRVIATELERFLSTVPGVYAIADDLTWGKPEVRLRVDEARAAMHGLTTAQVAQAVRAMVDGLTVTRTRLGKEEARVVVRFDMPTTDIMTMLAAVQIPTPTGVWVPLRDLVRMDVVPSMLRITRYDMERSVRVTAELDQKVITAQEVNRRIAAFLDRLLPNYPGYIYAFGGEAEEQRETVVSIFEAGVIAIVLIYAILATILRSYTQPFIIMSIVPFAIIGVVVGVLIRGEPFSMPALIGTVALLGVVVNDSLVLMDFINRRKRVLHRVAAVVWAARHRFRPVVLTTVTTFGGLSSLMVKTRGEAAYLAPMAVALGFGLVFATLITLFLIPALYLILDDFHAVWRRLRVPWFMARAPVPAGNPLSEGVRGEDPTHKRL